MNRQTLSRLMAILCMILAVVWMMWMMGDIGATKNGVPAAARKNSGIPSTQQMVESSAGKLDAMIFYDAGDPHGESCKAIVYEDRTGLFGSGINYKFAFGWHFRASVPCPDRGVRACTVENHSTVLYFPATPRALSVPPRPMEPSTPLTPGCRWCWPGRRVWSFLTGRERWWSAATAERYDGGQTASSAGGGRHLRRGVPLL